MILKIMGYSSFMNKLFRGRWNRSRQLEKAGLISIFLFFFSIIFGIVLSVSLSSGVKETTTDENGEIKTKTKMSPAGTAFSTIFGIIMFIFSILYIYYTVVGSFKILFDQKNYFNLSDYKSIELQSFAAQE